MEQFEEVSIEDQDLRVLKGLMTDAVVGNAFFAAHQDAHTLFSGDAKRFAKMVEGYYRAYRTHPTRRVLLEVLGDSHEFAAKCNYILNAIDSLDFSKDEFDYDLARLKQRKKKIRAQTLKQAIESSEDYDQMISWFKKEEEEYRKIEGKSNKKSVTRMDLSAYLPTFKFDYDEKKKNPEYKTGLKTGYSYIDYVTGGAQNSELWMVFGETSSGKSVFLNNLALNIWRQQNRLFLRDKNEKFDKGYNVLYFSLEMPFDICFRRTMACLAEVPIYGLRDSSLDIPQWQRVEQVAEFITKFPFKFEIIDIPRGASTADFEEQTKEAQNQFEVHAIAGDYLGLMERNAPNEDDWLKLANIAGELHELSRVLHIPVFSAAQLNVINKAGKTMADIVGNHRIGRAKGILHHVNVGIQIETRPEEESYPDFSCHFLKNRDGQKGSFSLEKDFKCANIKDIYMSREEIDEALGSGGRTAELNKDISEFVNKHRNKKQCSS